MSVQKKSPAPDTKSPQQMTAEIASMQALLMDHAAEFAKMRSAMQRLANRISELEKETRDTPSTIPTMAIPSGISCSKVPGGVIIYGSKIPLNKDTADVLYHLVCQNGSVSKERLTTLCTPQNKLNKGEHILSGSLYQRLRRLKEALNTYCASLGECIVSNKKSTKGTPHDYSFDAEKFRAILGIK